MKLFLLVAFIILISGALWTWKEFPVLRTFVLTDYVEKVEKDIDATETRELSGKTLFISDLHLVAEPSLEEQFNLDFSDVQNVVIVGDFFHTKEDFWSFGDTEDEAFGNILSAIVPENFSGQIFFIHATAHDPQNLETKHISFKNFEFFHVGEYGKFLIDGTSVLAFHGHQLHGGYSGGGVSWLANKLGHSLILEKLGKKRFHIPEETWVINGHSHVPGFAPEEKVGNTGSFVGAPLNDILFKLELGTGILFDGERVEQLHFEELPERHLYIFS